LIGAVTAHFCHILNFPDANGFTPTGNQIQVSRPEYILWWAEKGIKEVTRSQFIAQLRSDRMRPSITFILIDAVKPVKCVQRSQSACMFGCYTAGYTGPVTDDAHILLVRRAPTINLRTPTKLLWVLNLSASCGLWQMIGRHNALMCSPSVSVEQIKVIA